MSELSKKQIKEFKETEADAEGDFYELETVADNLAEAGDKEWAKKVYKKAENNAEDIDGFCKLADSLCSRLGDKKWAKKVYKKAENNAEDSNDFRNLADSIKCCLGDKDWAEDIIRNSIQVLTKGEIAEYSKWKPTKIKADYTVWEVEKEEGSLTVINKNGKKVKVEGYRIWENKTGASLTWKLPKSKGDAIKTLERETWEDNEISYDELDGFESSEGKGCTDYDIDGKELDKVKDFEGGGDTEAINFGSAYGPSTICLSLKGNKEMKFSDDRINWTLDLPNGEKRSLKNYITMVEVIKKIIG